MLAQSKRVASRVCKAASLQSSPTPAPRQLPASLWNLRALTPNTPPKVALATASREPLEPPRAGSEHPPEHPPKRCPCRGRWRVERRWPAEEDDAPDAGESSPVGPPGKTTAAPVEPPTRHEARAHGFDGCFFVGGGDGWAPDKALPLPGSRVRRGTCGLADLLHFEEEGGSFSFMSSKSARPCSARPEQTRRVACLQGCFFAELAHTRPATASREPVEPPRADSEHPPQSCPCDSFPRAFGTSARWLRTPPRTPPEALPLPRTLASRAPLACRGRRRPRRWRVEPRWPAGEDDGCACGTSARWPRSLPPSLGLDPPPKRRTKRWGGGDGWAPDKALPLPGRLPLRGVFSLRKALRLAKAIFVGYRPPSPSSAYRISSHTARHLLAADRGATKEMRRPLSRGDMPVGPNPAVAVQRLQLAKGLIAQLVRAHG